MPDVLITDRDEALTTWEAREAMKEMGLDPKKQKQMIDAFAAAVLLQEELNARGTGAVAL